MSKQNLAIAQTIDHTLLKPDATPDMILQVCEEARKHSFFSVCIPPCFVSLAKEHLNGSKVKICTVVGFPLGYTHTDVKAFEAQKAIQDGAEEIDMVMNLGHAKAGDWNAVCQDIRAVVWAANPFPVKVILETCVLQGDEIESACRAAEQAGAAFVKTSTGFGSAGAAAEHVARMKKTVGNTMQVKASGGIRTLSDYKAMVAAGADRIGASSGVAILKESDASL